MARWAIPVLAFSTALLLAGPTAGADERDDSEIRPVQTAADQPEALELARKVDLPELAKADRVVIEGQGGRRTELKEAGAIKELRRTLKVEEVPPSAGENAYNLSFYRDDTLIRKVWVFENGEWGFERPKGVSWTNGEDAALVRAIERHLPDPGQTDCDMRNP